MIESQKKCIVVCCEATSVFAKTSSPVLVLLIYLTHLHDRPEIFKGIMQSSEHCTISKRGRAIKGGTSSNFLVVWRRK